MALKQDNLTDLNLKVEYGTDLEPAVEVFHFAGSQSLQQPFDGPGQGLSFPTEALTLSLWLNTAQAEAVIFTYGPTDGQSGSRLTLMNPANLEVTLDSSSTGGTGVSFNDAQWHHLCVTLGRSGRSHYRVQIYKDGRLAYQSIGSLAVGDGGGLAATGQMILGNSATGQSAYLSGYASDFRLWQLVRGGLDVVTDMQRRLPTDTPGLLLDWFLESLTTEGPNTVDSFTPSSETSAPLRFRTPETGKSGYVVAEWSAETTGSYTFQMVADDGRWSYEKTAAVSPLAIPGVSLGRGYQARVGEVLNGGVDWSETVELTPLDLGQPRIVMSWPDAGQLTGSWQELDQSQQYQIALYRDEETTPAEPPILQGTTSTTALDSKINDANGWKMVVRALSENSHGPGNDTGGLDAPAMTLLYARDYEDPTRNAFWVSWEPIAPAPLFFYLSLSKNGEPPFLQTHWAGDAVSPYIVPYTATTFNADDQITGQLRAITNSALGQWDTETITILDLGGAPILNPLQLVDEGKVTASWTFDKGELTNVKYQAQLYSDPAHPIVTVLTDVDVTSTDLSYAGVATGTVLYVRVRAESEGSLGRWSQTQSFRVGSLLGQAKINDVCVNTNLTVTASWVEVGGAQAYLLTLRQPDDPTFERQLAGVTGTRVDWPQSSTNLEAQTQYTLTVEATATGQEPGPESNPWEFNSGTQCQGHNSKPVADPINQATGQYVYSHVDMEVNAVVPLRFITYYTSPLPDDNADVRLTPLGPHWNHYYNVSIEKTEDNSKALVLWGDGSVNAYQVPASLTGPYSRLGTPNGDQLYVNDDLTYRLTVKNQTVYNFDADGILQNIVARDGNRVELSYLNGQLKRITDLGSGRYLTLAYLETGQILTVTDDTHRLITYDYFPTTFDLRRVTDVQLNHRDFTYKPNSLLETLTDENGKTVITNDYWPDQRVKSQTDALQQTTSFAYQTSQDENGFEFLQTTVTDPMGYTSLYLCNAVTQGVVVESHTLTLTPGGQTRMISREFDGLNNLSSETIYEGPPIPLPLTSPLPGNVTGYTYDGNGNVLTITGPGAADPVGNLGTFVYDEYNNLTDFTDLLGNHTALHYEGNLLQYILRPLNYKQVFEYQDYGQSLNRLHVITEYPGNANQADPVGNVTTMSYDDQGQLVSVVDPLGSTIVLGYDTNNRGQLTSLEIRDETGAWLQRETIEPYPLTGWTHYDRVLFPTQPDARAFVTSYGYDNLGVVTSLTNALNFETRFDYYDNGLMQRITYPAESGDTPDKTGYEYDADNNLSRITYSESSPHVSNSYVFDPLSRITSFTDGNTQSTGYAYAMTGLGPGSAPPYPMQESVTYPKLEDEDEPYQTRMTYDPLGRVTKFTEVTPVSEQPDAPFTSIAYSVIPDPNHPGINQYQVIVTLPKAKPNDPEPYQITFIYDALRRLKSRTDENGKTWEITYTPMTDSSTTPQTVGQVITATDPLNNRKILQLDALGRVVKQEIPDAGNTTTLQKTEYEYDALNRLTKVSEQSPVGTGMLVSLYAYAYDDVSGQLRIIITPYNGPSSLYGYDGVGQLVQYTDSLAAPLNPITVLLGYTPRGQLETYSDGRQQVLTYGYDVAGRFTTLTPPGATAAEVITQMLDGNGNRLYTLSGTTTVITRTFDVLNRLTSRTRNAYNETVGYTYWPSNRLRHLTYPGISTPVEYEYDGLQRLKTVTDWQQRATRYTYYPTGQLETATLPGGVATRYDFDDAGRFTGFQTKVGSNIGEILLAQASYTLDEAGNPTALNQVLPVAPAFPVASQPMTYIGDRLDTVNGQAVSYDGDGNMTSIPGLTGTLTHNSLNQLVSVGATAQYSYDEDGLREIVTLSGKATRYVHDAADYISPLINQGDPERAIQFVTLTPPLDGPFQLMPWLGIQDAPEPGDEALNHVLLAIDSQNVVQAKYVYGHGLISREGGTDPTSYKLYIFDGEGTTLGLFAPAPTQRDMPGVMTDRYAYSPYGNSYEHSGTTPNPFLYHGRHGVMDEGLGLLYMRARYYCPSVLRFIEKDFLFGDEKLPQSLNRYVFVTGNPLQRVDPLGLSPWDTARIVGTTFAILGAVALGAAAFYLFAKPVPPVPPVPIPPVGGPPGGSPFGRGPSGRGWRSQLRRRNVPRRSSSQNPFTDASTMVEDEVPLIETEMQTINTNAVEAMEIEESSASGARSASGFSVRGGSFFNWIFSRAPKTTKID